MPRETTKVEKKEEKPPVTKASSSVGQAMRAALGQGDTTEARRCLSKANDELGALKKKIEGSSPFLAHILEDEASVLRKRLKGKPEELAPQLDRLIIDFSSREGAAEHLRTETIPNLELRLQARETDYVKKELARASLELRQLDALVDCEKFLSKLEFVLQYNYLPRALEHDTREFRRILEEPRTPQVEREAAIAQLEEKLDEFHCYTEPTKMRDYLLAERKALLKGGREDGEGVKDKGEMISLDMEKINLDLQRAKERLGETAPVSKPEMRIAGFRNHFTHLGYEMTTNAEGKKIYLVSAPDGSEVKFSKKFVLVISPFDETAVYERDETTNALTLAQVADSKKNIFKFRDGKITSARDADGNWFFFDPENVHPHEILDRTGARVLNEGDVNRLLSRINAARTECERDSGLDETEKRHFSFDEILSAAYKARKAAKQEHARISVRTPEVIEYTDAFVGKARASLTSQLISAGVLEHRRGVAPERRHVLKVWGGELVVKPATPGTFLTIAKAIKADSPANLTINPATTLLAEVSEKHPLDAEKDIDRARKGERPGPVEFYTKVITQKLKDGRIVSVLVAHSALIEAVCLNNFESLGKKLYEHIYLEARDKARKEWANGNGKAISFSDTLFHVRFELEVKYREHTVIVDRLRDRYGPRFLDAMRKRDYNTMGRQEAFDRLVHNGAHTITRQSGTYYAKEIARDETEEEKKLISGYLAGRLAGKSFGRQKAEVLKIVMEAYDRKFPTDKGELGIKVAQLRREFEHNSSEQTYEQNYREYQKADEFRDVVRDLTEKTGAFVQEAATAGGLPATEAAAEQGKLLFARRLALELEANQAIVVDEALAIALQNSKYFTRAKGTTWSIAKFIKAAMAEPHVGAEALFNAVRNEGKPWDVVRRANQFIRLQRGITHDDEDVFFEFARREGRDAQVRDALEMMGRAVGIAKDVLDMYMTVRGG